MKRDCPTIQELLAFDAVARHESITLAAGALCITVSAVSKQIAGLESFIGRPLLQKNGRSVQLTPQGRVYWQKIAGGLLHRPQAVVRRLGQRVDVRMVQVAVQ